MDLDAQIIVLQGRTCLMPGCEQSWTDKAHIEPSGMGGRPSTSTPANLVGLCRGCHDIFDGRNLHGRQRMLRLLMRSHADHVRRRIVDPSLVADAVAAL